jgi:ASC-1-like (ASCH) protein
VSYDDDRTVHEYFNVSLRGDLALHNKANHFMVSLPSFQQYQTVKEMLAMGTFEVHQPGVYDMLERLCKAMWKLWDQTHDSMHVWAEEVAREA